MNVVLFLSSLWTTRADGRDFLLPRTCLDIIGCLETSPEKKAVSEKSWSFVELWPNSRESGSGGDARVPVLSTPRPPEPLRLGSGPTVWNTRTLTSYRPSCPTWPVCHTRTCRSYKQPARKVPTAADADGVTEVWRWSYELKFNSIAPLKFFLLTRKILIQIYR